MTETILVLNSGSSSIKFQLFAASARERLERRMKGMIEGIGTRPRFTAKVAKGDAWSTRHGPPLR
jgi:acetate kinase